MSPLRAFTKSLYSRLRFSSFKDNTFEGLTGRIVRVFLNIGPTLHGLIHALINFLTQWIVIAIFAIAASVDFTLTGTLVFILRNSYTDFKRSADFSSLGRHVP